MIESFARAGTALLAALLAAGAGAPAAAQDDAQVRQNLLQLIQLRDFACDEVTEYERQGPYDFVATCSNGARYHVHRDGSGQVLVEAVPG